MGDVVLKLPVRGDQEAQLFGAFLNRFLESCAEVATRWAISHDEPYLMVRTDPQPGLDLKVLIFQENSVAQAFRSGWDSLVAVPPAAPPLAH